MFDYVRDLSFVKHLTEEQIEAAYRVCQVQNRTTEIKARAETMYAHGDISLDGYQIAFEDARDIAERFLNYDRDPNLAENEVMMNLIMRHCKEREARVDAAMSAIFGRKQPSLAAQIYIAQQKVSRDEEQHSTDGNSPAFSDKKLRR